MRRRSGGRDLCGTEGAGYPSYAAGGEKIRNAIHSKKCVGFFFSPELPSGYGIYVKPAGHLSSCVSNRVPVAWQ